MKYLIRNSDSRIWLKSIRGPATLGLGALNIEIMKRIERTFHTKFLIARASTPDRSRARILYTKRRRRARSEGGATASDVDGQ